MNLWKGISKWKTTWDVSSVNWNKLSINVKRRKWKHSCKSLSFITRESAAKRAQNASYINKTLAFWNDAGKVVIATKRLTPQQRIACEEMHWNIITYDLQCSIHVIQFNCLKWSLEQKISLNNSMFHSLFQFHFIYYFISYDILSIFSFSFFFFKTIYIFAIAVVAVNGTFIFWRKKCEFLVFVFVQH